MCRYGYYLPGADVTAQENQDVTVSISMALVYLLHFNHLPSVSSNGSRSHFDEHATSGKSTCESGVVLARVSHSRGGQTNKRRGRFPVNPEKWFSAGLEEHRKSRSEFRRKRRTSEMGGRIGVSGKSHDVCLLRFFIAKMCRDFSDDPTECPVGRHGSPSSWV